MLDIICLLAKNIHMTSRSCSRLTFSELVLLTLAIINAHVEQSFLKTWTTSYF